MNFNKVRKVKLPGGDYYNLGIDGQTLWKNMIYYVNLGDSVGEGSGASDPSKNYFSLLRDEMKAKIDGGVKGNNYAHGGDRIKDLILMLDKANVRESVSKADIITVSIGGNDILSPCFDYLMGYISGEYSLEFIGAACKAELDKLLSDDESDDEGDLYTYKKMLDELLEINSDATYVFTNQYHPYKYLYLEEGSKGFFKPILDLIPQVTILGSIEIDEIIKEELLSYQIVQVLFEKINALAAWIADLIDTLNSNLSKKIQDYKDTYNSKAKLYMTDTHSLFEVVPDRLGKGEVHFNDLNYVEFTRGYNWGDIKWGVLWDNRKIEEPILNESGAMIGTREISDTPCNSAYEFWMTLIGYYLFNSNYEDIKKNIEKLAITLLYMVKNYVIMPTLDLHPKDDGYYLIMRSFANELSKIYSLEGAKYPKLSGLPRLNTISYNGGKASGEMKPQLVLNDLQGRKIYTHLPTPNFTPAEGYYFTEWKDQEGKSYSNNQEIYVASDLNLTANWSNMYTVNFYKALNDLAGIIYPDEGNQTGVQEIYGVDVSYDGGNTFTELDPSLYRGYFGPSFEDYIKVPIPGDEQKLWAPNKISSPSFPYGTKIRVWVTYTLGDQKFGIDKYSETTAHIYKDGELKVSAYDAEFTFTITKDTNIYFEWFLTGTVYFNATANWNCHIV